MNLLNIRCIPQGCHQLELEYARNFSQCLTSNMGASDVLQALEQPGWWLL